MAARRERPWWEPDCAGGNGVNDRASDDGASSDVHPEFPSLRMPSAVIYNVRERNQSHPLARDDDAVNNDGHEKTKRNWFYYGRKDP